MKHNKMLPKKSNSRFISVFNLLHFSSSKRSTSPLCLDIIKNSFPKHKRSTSPLCLDIIKNSFPKHKRSQSEVIATILLILLAIVAVFIIMNFAIPFVKNQLSEADCFDVYNVVTIVENKKYTCYSDSSIPSSKSLRVQIHVGENESLGGFMVEISGSGTSRSYEIKNGVIIPGFKMYPDTGEDITVPGKNEERTYEILPRDPLNNPLETVPDYVRVYPLLSNGKLCDSFDEINEIPLCT